MPLHYLCCGSSTALLMAAAFALLVVPPNLFFVRDAFLSSHATPEKLVTLEHVDDLAKLHVAVPKNTFADYFQQESVDFFPCMLMFSIGFAAYLYEWVHRKLMERRILKLRAFLGASLERLRETESRRHQLEGTLRLARGAAAEYNLLLYLLLRKRKEETDWGQQLVV